MTWDMWVDVVTIVIATLGFGAVVYNSWRARLVQEQELELRRIEAVRDFVASLLEERERNLLEAKQLYEAGSAGEIDQDDSIDRIGEAFERKELLESLLGILCVLVEKNPNEAFDPTNIYWQMIHADVSSFRQYANLDDDENLEST